MRLCTDGHVDGRNRNRKYPMVASEVQPWIDAHECVRNYLDKLNTDQLNHACYLYNYLDWVKKKTEGTISEPEQLLELKNEYRATQAEKLLDSFVASCTTYPDCTKACMIKAVRGFYTKNYADLRKEAGTFDYTAKKTYDEIPKETCLKLYKNTYGYRDKCLVMYATSTAIARESLTLLRWSHFEEDWENVEVPYMLLPSEIIKGHGKGKYKGVKQVSFLTPEAKQIVLEYREWYAKTFKYTWKPDDYVFLQTKGSLHTHMKKNAISLSMERIANRAGITYGLHDGRSRVQTALENIKCPNNWIKKIKGRKCGKEEAPYSRPAIEKLREVFKEALPEIQFLTEPVIKTEIKTVDPGLQKRVDTLEDVIKQQREQLERFAKLLGQWETVGSQTCTQ